MFCHNQTVCNIYCSSEWAIEPVSDQCLLCDFDRCHHQLFAQDKAVNTCTTITNTTAVYMHAFKNDKTLIKLQNLTKYLRMNAASEICIEPESNIRN